ncbi:MAG TPA: DUF2798 domain-containing protein [Xanthobacteraceae bacterium]|nr:DUF2798 domain-containing protein [Xanthobacteraceae bacterium]
MAAAGQSEQREKEEKTDERPLNSTRHEGDNASNSVNDCSNFPAPWAKECVNHDDGHARDLDPGRPFGPDRRPAGGSMEGKAKFIFPVLATAIVVFVVSCVVTFTDIGFRADFMRRWLSAFFLIGWSVASVIGLIAFPYVRRATAGIVALIERA